jgi:hypothetical protein
MVQGRQEWADDGTSAWHFPLVEHQDGETMRKVGGLPSCQSKHTSENVTAMLLRFTSEFYNLWGTFHVW